MLNNSTSVEHTSVIMCDNLVHTHTHTRGTMQGNARVRQGRRGVV